MDKGQQLYNALTKRGVNLGSYDQFIGAMQDGDKRKKIYNALTGRGANLGSYDQFSSVFVDGAEAVDATTQQTVERAKRDSYGAPSAAPKTTQHKPKKSFPTMPANVPLKFTPQMPNEFKGGFRYPKLTGGSNVAESNIRQVQEQEARNAKEWEKSPMKARIEQERRLKEYAENAPNEEEDEALKFRMEHPWLAAVLDQDHIVGPGEQSFIPTALETMNKKSGRTRETKRRQAILNQLDEANTIRREAANNRDGIVEDAKAFGRGFGKKFTSVSTWDKGRSDFDAQEELYRISEKYRNGEELTESERYMLEAYAINNKIQQELGDDVNDWYKYGAMSAKSLPFMLEMALTGGGKALGNASAKFVLKAVGKSAMNRLLKRLLINSAKVGGDALGATAQTALLDQREVVTDAYRRQSGYVIPDDRGNKIRFGGFTKGESAAQAYGKAFASQWTENFSELVGEYFSPVTGALFRTVGKGGSKMLTKLGQQKLNKVIKEFGKGVSTAKWSKAIKDFSKRSQWHGVVGEFLEEVVGSTMNSLITGDESLSDVYSRKNLVDTFMGVAPMSMFFSGVAIAGYRTPHYRLRKELEKATANLDASMGEEQSEAFRAAFADATDEERKKLINQALDISETEEQRKAVMEYTLAHIKMNAYNEQKAASQITGEQHPSEQQAEASYAQGVDDFTNNGGDEKLAELEENVIQAAQAIDEELYRKILHIYYGDHSKEEMSQFIDSLSPEKAGLVQNWLNAKAELDGYKETETSETLDAAHEQGKQTKEPIDMHEALRRFNEVDARLQADSSLYAALMTYIDGGANEAAINQFFSGLTREEQMLCREWMAAREVLNGIDEGTEEDISTEGDAFAAEFAPAVQDGKITVGRDKEGKNVYLVPPVQDGEIWMRLDDEGNLVPAFIGDYTDVQTYDAQEFEAEGRNNIAEVKMQQKDDALNHHPMTHKPQAGEIVYNGQTAYMVDYDGEGNVTLQQAEKDAEGWKPVTGTPIPVTMDEVLDMMDKYYDAIDNAHRQQNMEGQGESLASERQAMAAIRRQDDDDEGGEPPMGGAPVIQQTAEEEAQAEPAVLTPQERWQKEVDEMGEEYARKYVDSSIASLEEAIRKARKQEPKLGSTPEKIKEFLLNQRDNIAEMERQLEEFRQMKGVMNADVRHVVRDVQPKAKESEYSIMKRKYVDDAEVMEILNADDPQTIDEVIATMLASGAKIMGKSENVNGVHYDGYQAHTGYGTEEQKRLAYYIRTRANGGVSFDRFVEMVESRAIEWGVDVTGKDVTTEVLNFFQQLSGSVKDYIHNKRVAQAQEYIAQREAAEEADSRKYFFEDTHFTPEEYELWNEYMEAVARERTEEFDSQELRDIFAEAYELIKQNNGKTNSIYEGVSEGQGVQQGSEGSVQVDEGEQAAAGDTNQEGGADEGLQPAGETGNGGVHEASDGTGTVGQAVAQAEQETDVNPTDGQKEAGNYKKGHVSIDGFDITIENPKGSVRSGKDASGKEWSVTMNNTYGYIRGTEGVDGDHIDVFLSDNLDGWNGTVYVVDQVNEDGSFDEHKVMYGFNSEDEAATAYNSNYSEGWQGLGTITGVSLDEFKKWVNSSHRKTKPFAEYKTVDKEVEAKKVEETTENESKADEKQKNVNNLHTSMYKQYQDIKKKHPDVRLLFRTGDFYEVLDEDATAASKILGLKITQLSNIEGADGKALKMAGFPYHALDTYLPKLIRAGERVAIVDQLEDPKTKTTNKGNITEAAEEGKPEGKQDIGLKSQGASPAPTVKKQSGGRSVSSSEKKIEDWGEKIAGARKDMLADIAKTLDNVTAQSLVQQPLSKAFKRPDLKKLTETGALTEKEALAAEAIMAALCPAQKPKAGTKEMKRAMRYYGRDLMAEWAEKAAEGIETLNRYLKAAPEEREKILEEITAEDTVQRAAETVETIRLRELNPDHDIPDVHAPNPVKFALDVLESIGYEPGQKIGELPKVEVQFGRLQLLNEKGGSLVSVNTVEEAREKAAFMVMLREGMPGLQIPVREIKIGARRREQSEEIVAWAVRYYRSSRLTDLAEERFDTREEAEKRLEELKTRKGRVKDAVIAEIHGYTPTDYTFYVRDEYTNEYIEPEGERGYKFATRDEAQAYLEEHYDEVNERLVARNAEMKNKQQEKQDSLYVAMTYGEKGRRYSIICKEPFMNKLPGIFGGWMPLKDFDTREEAEKYLAEHREEVYAPIAEMKEKMKNFVYFGPDRPRVGEDWRGDRDVTEQELGETFGFRGVQFGNWTNDKDRQKAVNEAYDALKDLAHALGISDKAIGLNGELGIAFGARGTGSANAHYEPQEVVINLTKTRGAGSLAHEWLHALDNYFSRAGGDPAAMVTATKVTNGMRPELREAWNELMDAVHKSNYYTRSVKKGRQYWGTDWEVAARLFAEWINDKLEAEGKHNSFLSRGVDQTVFDDYLNYTYLMYETAQRRKRNWKGEPLEVMSKEEFAKTPAALGDMPYPTKEETKALAPLIEKLFGTMEEETRREGTVALYSRGMGEPGTEVETEIDKATTEFVMDAAERNRKVGVNTYVLTEEQAEMELARIEEARENASPFSRKQKRALETVSVSQNEEHLQSVVTSAQGAKVVKNLDKYAKNLDLLTNSPVKTFLGDVAEALGARKHGSGSQYATFGTKNGRTVTIRLADHNARVSTFDNHGEEDGISIVVTAKKNEGAENNGQAHVVEFYYDAIKLRRVEGKPLAGIVRSIKQALYSGEYKDTTGLAERQELNGEGVARFSMRVYHGSGADFDRFDHSHMGEGEGAQAFGWGTYVTEVEGIGRTYAKSNARPYSASIDGRVILVNQNAVISEMNGEQFAAQKLHLNFGDTETAIDNTKENIEYFENSIKFFKEQISYDKDDAGKRRDVRRLETARKNLQTCKEALDILESGKIEIKYNDNASILYTVEVPEDNGSNYIDWDKTMVHQPEVMKAVEDYMSGNEVAGFRWQKSQTEDGRVQFRAGNRLITLNPRQSGADMYEEFKAAFGGKTASKVLHDAGLTGIKYPAQYMTGGREDGAKNYVIFDEGDLKIEDKVRMLRDSKGVVYGWTKNGQIYLTPKGVNPNTPVHEYAGHIWGPAVRKNNPELWERFKDLAKESPIWEEILQEDAYSDIWGSDDLMAEEVIGRGAGRRNAEQMKQKMEEWVKSEPDLMKKAEKASLWHRLREALASVKRWIAEHVFQMKPEQFETVDDVFDKAISDFYNEVELRSDAKRETGEDMVFRDGDEDVLYRIREDEPPTKTGKGYKVFVLKNGKLYPPMVANPGGEATPVGVWLDADAAPVIGTTKTGRQRVKAGGKGTQGGSGVLSYRPGWHLGEIPYAIQFNRINPETGEKELFPANFVWAEVEYANDVDYNDEAKSYGMTENGSYKHSYAGLPRVPENGSYKYRTNPNPETDPWIITGAMKVNRILTPSEVDKLVTAAGREPQKRQEGAVSDEDVRRLNENLADDMQREGSVSSETAERSRRRTPAEERSAKAYAKREYRRGKERAEGLIEKMGIADRAKVYDSIDDVPGSKDFSARKRRAKGWFDKKSGQIVIVMGNHRNAGDVVQTVLHEAVAHYGLRKLFGDNFNNFLDNVYKAGEQGIRDAIDRKAEALKEKAKNSDRTDEDWRRVATEEYMAELAENTDFEGVEERSGIADWFHKIKNLFLDMLHKLGVKGWERTGPTISDNELRYILWRSYKNLTEPGRYENHFAMAEDVVMQNKLKVGEYAEEKAEAERAAEMPTSLQELKATHPGVMMIVRNGDFYELYGEDADKGERILGIDAVRRDDGSALAGFPADKLDEYLPKLIQQGERVAFVAGLAEGNVKYSRASVPLTEEEKELRDALVENMKRNGIDVDMSEEGQRVIDELNEVYGSVRAQAQIGALAKAANMIRRWLKNNSRDKWFSIELPEATQKMVRRAMGRDFDSHSIYANGIAHAKKNHGVEGEKIDENSIPLRDEDFELAPYIMVAPDEVHPGSMGTDGRESIRFIKKLENGVVLVVEKENRNSPNDMETINMWADMSFGGADARFKKRPLRSTSQPVNVASNEKANTRTVISDTDAAKIRKDAELAIEKDKKISEMRAYHGSGADFDRFDHSHMGEGEGAQAFGWGTYVTEVEGIGKTYAKSVMRKPVGSRPVRYKGEAIGDVDQTGWSDAKKNVFRELVELQAGMGRNASSANQYLKMRLEVEAFQSERGLQRAQMSEEKWTTAKKYIDSLSDEQYSKLMNNDSWQNLDGELRYLKYAISEGRDLGRGGILLVCEQGVDDAKHNRQVYDERKKSAEEQLACLSEFSDDDFTRSAPEPIVYTVDIPEDNGRRYLDYDAKMEQQPNLLDAIGEGLEKRGWKRNGMTWSNNVHKVGFELASYKKGSQVYEALAKMMGSQKMASDFLRSIGIVGIKYPSQFLSGGREDGAKNYVIFDEDDLKITNKERLFRGKNGEVYGFVKDGRIYLDPRIASAETAVHEYGHLWCEALRKANPEAWKRLTDDLLSHEDVVEQVKKLYPELEGDELAEEVFTHFAGRRGAERLRAERDRAVREEHTVMGKARIAVAFERLREALHRFWEAARDLFAGRNEKLSEYTAEDFADMMMADLMNGWKPGPGEGTMYSRRQYDPLSYNSGYTERENGTPLSERARQAESEGKFTEGTFRQKYGIARKSFDMLRDLGLLYTREWHHVGKNFAEKDFYEWRDHSRQDYGEENDGFFPEGSLAERYNENKKEIDALVKEAETSEWTNEPLLQKKGVPEYEQWKRSMLSTSYEDFLTEGEKKAREERHAFISSQSDVMTAHDRYEEHSNVDDEYKAIASKRADEQMRREYNERFSETMRRDELVDAKNEEIRRRNAEKRGREAIIAEIAEKMGMSPEEAREKAEKLSDKRRAADEAKRREEIEQKWEAERQKVRDEARKRQDAYVRKLVKEGKAQFVERTEFRPEFFITEREEMNGRYGWFEANTMYNLPIYYSGIKFADKRSFNHYNKIMEDIRPVLDEMADKEYEEKYLNKEQNDDDVLFSDDDDNNKEKKIPKEYAAKAYDKRLKQGTYRFQEAYQDSMLSVKELQDMIAKETGSEIRDFENAYIAENALSSKNLAEMEAYRKLLYTPILEEIAALQKEGMSYNDIKTYIMAKHGLERNIVLAKRDALRDAPAKIEEFRRDLKSEHNKVLTEMRTIKRQFAAEEISEDEYNANMFELETQRVKIDRIMESDESLREYVEGALEQEYRKKDYSGLTALFAEDEKMEERLKQIDALETEAKELSKIRQFNEAKEKRAEAQELKESLSEFAEQLAKETVEKNEAEHDFSPLWEKINAATKATLAKQLEAGMLSQDQYQSISEMFEYYVPLRGFDETTSDEVYNYLQRDRGPANSPIKAAEGRKSLADDPIAVIGNMAETGVTQANRNMMKQAFLRMAQAHPTDMLSVSRDVWLEYDAAEDRWKPAPFADIPNNATTNEIKEIVAQWEAHMAELAELYPDLYRNSREWPDIPYRVINGNLNEHQVHVKVNGKDYIITINGNPRAAQAINGLTNPHGADSKIMRWVEAGNRFLSANVTSRNPAFILTNLVKDAIHANSTVWVREGTAYAIQYNRNWGKAFAKMAGLLRRLKNNTLDMNNEADRLFYEFIMNGGETGYTVVHDVETYRKMMEKELKYYNRKGAAYAAEAAYRMLSGSMDTFGRWAELTSRFTAYATSRENGRSIARSVWDAKEITVNFNKKGAGNATENSFMANTSQFGRGLYIFWNAGVQALTNFMRLAKNNWRGFAKMSASFFVGGAVQPLLCQAMLMMLGGDPDDYWKLPEYVRRTNICLYTGTWVTIPLPIELRSLWGFGELASGQLLGGTKYHPMKLAWKIAEQAGQVLPLDPTEGSGGFSAFVPSYAKPVYEAYGSNTDWTGMPIYKENDFNRNMPEWTKAYKGTTPELVKLSKVVNEATGGNKYKKGWVNFNPAKIEHLFEGYLGGVATMATQSWKTTSAIWNKDMREMRNVPIASRFIKSSDERARLKAIKERYFENKKLMEEFGREYNGFMRDVKNPALTPADRGEAMTHINSLMRDGKNGISKRWRSYEEWKKMESALQKLRKAEDLAPEALQEQEYDLMEDMNKIAEDM